MATAANPANREAVQIRSGDRGVGMPDERSAPTDEAVLVAAVAVGSEDALASLYDRHANSIFATAYRLTGDRSGAEDVVQEVFLTLWNRAERFDPAVGSLAAWLGTIARNRAVDRLRAASRRPQLVSLSPIGGDDEPDSSALERLASAHGTVGGGVDLAAGDREDADASRAAPTSRRPRRGARRRAGAGAPGRCRAAPWSDRERVDRHPVRRGRPRGTPMMEHDDIRAALEIAAVEPGGLDRLAAGDTGEAAALAGHLAGCTACMDELTRLRRADMLLRPVLATTAPPELRARTLAYVRAMGRERGAQAVAAPMPSPPDVTPAAARAVARAPRIPAAAPRPGRRAACLLYTSDA